MNINTVQISPIFTKHILDLSAEGWSHFQPMLHHFTGPDTSPPHGHPWDFTTTILKGGYRERIYHVNEEGEWYTETIDRLPGQTHFVSRDCIHQVIELLDGDCWTIVVPGHGNGFDWQHYEFDPVKEIKL